MKKLIQPALVILLFVILLIPACGGIKVTECHPRRTDDPFGEGKVTEIICTGEFNSAIDLDIMVQTIDPSNVVLDVSGGNVQVNSFSGNGYVKKLTVGGVVVASDTFSWTRLGNSLIITNPDNVSVVLESNPGQAVKFEFAFSNIQTSSNAGLNTLVTTLFYENTAYESVQSSWFCEDDVNGSPSSTILQICGN